MQWQPGNNMYVDGTVNGFGEGGSGNPVEKPAKFTVKKFIPSEDEAILTEIPRNAKALIFTLRWVDFILKRVPRKRISELLRMYTDLGWISEFARYQLLGYFRASLPDRDYEEFESVEGEIKQEGLLTDNPAFDDFRMTASDHIKSLLFILEIKGLKVDTKLVESVEEHVRAILEHEYF